MQYSIDFSQRYNINIQDIRRLLIEKTKNHRHTDNIYTPTRTTHIVEQLTLAFSLI